MFIDLHGTVMADLSKGLSAHRQSTVRGPVRWVRITHIQSHTWQPLKALTAKGRRLQTPTELTASALSQHECGKPGSPTFQCTAHGLSLDARGMILG